MSKRGKPVTQQIREERRRMAEERNKEYNEKYPTPQAKLDALPPTGASKQRARLTAQIAAEKAEKEAKLAAEQAKADAKAEKSENKKGKKQ